MSSMNKFCGLVRPITKEQKQLWLTALRSGNFKQGSGYLRTINPIEDVRYCCLGVLDTVCALNSVSGTELEDNEGNQIALPQKIQNELIEFNDTALWDFGRIADWIETNVKVEGETNE